MGFLDKLIDMKKEHDRKVAEEQERARQERERKEREAREQDAALMRRLETSELTQGIIRELRTSPWFSESQGSGDSNRREVIITPVALYFDNYDKDVFFRYLCQVEANGTDGAFYTIHRENYVQLKRVGDSSYVEKFPTPETRYVDEILEKYDRSAFFQRNLVVYQSWNYEAILERELLRKFATALKNELQKEYSDLQFSDIKENKYGFFMFEMFTHTKSGKNI